MTAMRPPPVPAVCVCVCVYLCVLHKSLIITTKATAPAATRRTTTTATANNINRHETLARAPQQAAQQHLQPVIRIEPARNMYAGTGCALSPLARSPFTFSRVTFTAKFAAKTTKTAHIQQQQSFQSRM